MNWYKVLFIIPVLILVLLINFIKFTPAIFLSITAIIWLLVAYTISLNINAHSITDIDYNKLKYALPASLAMTLGTVFLLNHKYQYIVAIGVILFVFGKIGIIDVELGLLTGSQRIVLLSTGFIVIGQLVELLDPEDKIIYLFGKIMSILGWILFATNVIYNSPFKSI